MKYILNLYFFTINNNNNIIKINFFSINNNFHYSKNEAVITFKTIILHIYIIENLKKIYLISYIPTILNKAQNLYNFKKYLKLYFLNLHSEKHIEKNKFYNSIVIFYIFN